MPETLGLSGPPLRVNRMTTWPLELAVVLNVRAMARLAPPAAAKMSNAVSTVAPLMATLKVRWRAAVQKLSSNHSVTAWALPAVRFGMV
jgi:hypothetical protein